MIALLIIIALPFLMFSLPNLLLSLGFIVLKPDIVQSDWLPYSQWGISLINLVIITLSVVSFWFFRYNLYWSYLKSIIISFLILLFLLFLENFVFKLSYKSDYIESGEGWLSFLFTFLGVLGYLAGISLFSMFKKDIGIHRFKIFEFIIFPFNLKKE